MSAYDVTVIGGGILGLATALKLLESEPTLKLAVVEKEKELARHQTGNNSGVIHSGIYYKPGSLKAKNCVKGARELKAFATEHDIEFKAVGKVIVATDEKELPRLNELYRRGQANAVPGLELIGPERLKEIEPEAAGLQALYSPETSVIDFRRVALVYAERIKAFGGHIFLGEAVLSVRKKKDIWELETSRQELQSYRIINCAGLQSDRVATMASVRLPGRIFPFRGEYYTLSKHAGEKVRGLIYPVPDPKFPFLGVHVSRTIHGQVEAGPNAVLSFSREGYTYADISLTDMKEVLSYPGFWALARKYYRVGAYEMYRSLVKGAFLKALRRLMPSLQSTDLTAGGAGVRAQLVHSDGSMADDFCLVEEEGAVHVLNAPSPAATASLAIGKTIADCVPRTAGKLS